MSRRWIGVLAVVVAASGCGSKKPAAEAAARDTLSTRARQEKLGGSGIPGARGVSRALQVSDSATARNARLDSINERD